MTLAIGYVREASGGGTLDEQRAAILYHASQRGLELLRIEADGLAVDSARRAVFAALERQESTVLIVCSLAILSDTLVDFLYTLETYFLNQGTLELHLIEERFLSRRASLGPLLRAMIDRHRHRIALYERMDKATRGIAVERGPGGTPRFGYAVGEDARTLVRDNEEQSIILHLITIRDSGLSWTKCVEAMNTQFPHKARGASRQAGSGGVWHRTTVQRIYAREVRR